METFPGDRRVAARASAETQGRFVPSSAAMQTRVQVLCDQLKDSARSGPRNIAEGFGRFSNKQFAHFVTIAKGSEAEVLNHFIDAHDQGLITDQELREGEYAALKAMKAAIGLIKHLENSPDPQDRGLELRRVLGSGELLHHALP
jgi:four helix bundle protein